MSENGDQAKARARPFRVLQAVQIGDVVVGLVVYFGAGAFGVPGTVAGLPVMEFVGLALIAIGVVGWVLFEALARRAMERGPRT